MLGKLAGAWIGEKVAGPNRGAKGAILGYGAAALARRSVPALAAIALGGWAFRKWRERRAGAPSYPSDATPAKSPLILSCEVEGPYRRTVLRYAVSTAQRLLRMSGYVSEADGSPAAAAARNKARPCPGA